MKNQKIESTTTLFQEMGFQDEKEFKKYNSDARRIWKDSHKVITYDVELLTKGETQMLMADPDISRKAKELADKKQELIDLVEYKIKEMRGQLPLITELVPEPEGAEPNDDTPIQANNQNIENQE
jgi:hypothetical protein